MKAIFDRAVHLVNLAAVALAVIAFVDFIRYPLAGDHEFGSPLLRALVILLLLPLNLLVGFLIRRRVPGNIVGPLLVVWSGTVAYFSIRADIHPVLFAAYFAYDMVFGWLGLFLMLAHFPDGKIFPPRLAPWVYRLTAISWLIVTLTFLSFENLLFQGWLPNPFYLPALGPYSQAILAAGLLLFMPLLLLAMVSPFLRFRKGSYREREQIKWLALFGGLLIIYSIPTLIVYPMATGRQVMDPGSGPGAVIFYLGTGLFPPLAIGAAILRHRLWDIDFIIRRTLVYSILTGLIALLYFGAIALVQAVLTTGRGLQALEGGQPSAIVIVGTTLLVATIFNPLRRGLQETIDRRFYRRKYNAEQVMESFGATLRENADLNSLEASILKVVEDTMQPEHASLVVVKPRDDRGSR